MKRNGPLKRELIRQDNPTLVGLAPTKKKKKNPTPHKHTFHLQIRDDADAYCQWLS
jgi:hypothetical protein